LIGSMNESAQSLAISSPSSPARIPLAMSSGVWPGWKLIHESTIMCRSVKWADGIAPSRSSCPVGLPQWQCPVRMHAPSGRAARLLSRRAAGAELRRTGGWRVAAQNGLAATMVALLLQAAPARADGAPNLILPLVTAIAFATAASNVPRQVATLDPGRRPLLSLLPKQVQIVDGYQYDFEDYVGLKRPSDMVDSDRIVSYDILRQPRRGWTAFVAYDEEYRGPLTSRSDVLRIEFKHRF